VKKSRREATITCVIEEGSQLISAGNLSGPWDPYGWCGQPGNPNG
jgi:hypothetical protein